MNKTQQFLIIPGTHKSGTTSLYEYLSVHPQIFAPLKKELHYFTPLVYGNELPRNERYEDNFKEAKDEKYFLDISPSYLYGGNGVIEQLQNTGMSKVLLILRNPTTRFISFYKQGIITGNISSETSLSEFFNSSLESYNEYTENGIQKDNFLNRSLREGCYASYIENWFRVFQSDMKIIFFEDLIKNPEKCMASVCEWLQIASIYEKFDFKTANKSFKPKSQKMSTAATKIFRRNERFFRKNKKLKLFFKKIYNRLNRSKFEQPEVEIMKKINDFYLSHNNKLMGFFNQKKMKTPNW